MRCKKHYTDHSSSVGVCASCLRERLFCLLRAQSQSLEDNNCNSEVQTDNSASSNDTERNGDRNRHYSIPDRRFFSTPQVAPIAGSYNTCRKKHQRFFNFSLLSNLFGSKKRNEDSNPRSSVSVSNNRGSCGGDDRVTSATSGGGHRKKQPICSDGVMRKQYCPNRGMSPVRYSDCDSAEDDAGYETCESRKQTPRRTPVVRRGGGNGNGYGYGYGKSVSGLSFCLSPLVRVSPCRNWNQKGVVPVDSSEFRAPVKVHPCNRSRKFADFGRFATDR